MSQNKPPRGSGLHIQCTLEPQTFASLVVLLQQADIPFRPSYSDVLRTLIHLVIADLAHGTPPITDPEEAILFLSRSGFSTSQVTGHRQRPYAKTLSLASLRAHQTEDPASSLEDQLKDLLAQAMEKDSSESKNNT